MKNLMKYLKKMGYDSIDDLAAAKGGSAADKIHQKLADHQSGKDFLYELSPGAMGSDPEYLEILKKLLGNGK